MVFQLYADDVLIFQDGEVELGSQYFLDAPTYKSEIGKTASISFTILPNHPRYQYIEKIKTKIKAVKNGNIIFRGRVLDISSDIYDFKQVTCEDALSFLNDSYLDKYEGTTTGQTILEKCINGHNDKVDNSRKITLGTVDVAGMSKSKKYTINAWASPLSAIESALVNELGGYLQIRYSGDTIYLDYLDSVVKECSQTIETSVNLMDFSMEESGDGYFTVLIPTGDNDKTIKSDVTAQTKTLSDGTVIETKQNDPCIYFPNAIAKYDKIYHPEKFDDKKNTADILAAAEDWIVKNYRENPLDLTITAVDLSALGVDVDELQLGQAIRIQVPTCGIDKVYQAISFEEDPTSPVGKSFKFIDVDKSNSTMSGGGGGGSSGGGISGGAGGFGAKCLWAENEVIIQKGLIDLQAATITLHTGQLEDHDARIALTEHTVNIMGEEINLHAEELIDLNTHWLSIDADITEIGHRVTTVETDVTDMSATLLEQGYDILRIDTAVTEIGGDLTQAQYDILQHQTTLEGHTASITAINTDITAIDSSVTLIGSELTQAQQDIVNNNQSIIALNADVVSVENELQAAKARISELESDAITTNNLSAKISQLGTVSVNALSAGSITTSGSVNVGAGLSVGNYVMIGDNRALHAGDDPLQTFSVDQNGDTITLTWTSIFGGHSGSKSFSSAGAVSLSGVWSGNTYTVTASPSGLTNVTKLTVGWDNPQEYSISMPGQSKWKVIGVTFETDDWANHKKNYRVIALEDGVGHTAFQGAIDATGQYNAGWTEAYGKVELPAGSMSSSFLVKTPPSTVDGAAITTAYAIQDPVINGENSYIQVKNSGGTVVASKTIGNVYKAGWDAVDSGTFKYTFPEPSGTYPNKVVNVRCDVTLENDKVVWNQYDSALLSGYVNNAYNSGKSSVVPKLVDYWQDGGVVIQSNPTAEENLSRKIIPGSYTWSGNTASGDILVSYNGGQSGYAFGVKYSVDASSRYEAGRSAVTLSGSWTGATYTVIASNDKEVSTTLTPSPANASTISTFTSHKAYINVSAPGITGPLFHWTVDTTSEYNAGYNAGLAAGKASMGLVRNGNSISLLDGSTIKKYTANYTASKHTAGTLNWTNVRQTAGPGVGKIGNTVQYSSSSVYKSLTASISGDEYTASKFSWSFST